MLDTQYIHSYMPLALKSQALQGGWGRTKGMPMACIICISAMLMSAFRSRGVSSITSSVSSASTTWVAGVRPSSWPGLLSPFTCG